MPYLFCLLFNLIAYTTLAQQPTKNDSEYSIQEVLIPTRSGIDISATIVRDKNANAPLPVLLFHTTYHQGDTDANFGKRSVDRNYVGVVSYSRGIKTAIENYKPYEHEVTDVYDIIDWISKQDWCNGSVGMFGGSYTGFSQWATVKNIHPSLKTIVPQVAVMPGYDTPMENNVEMNLGLYWSHNSIYKKKPLDQGLPFEWFENGIAFKDMDSLAGYRNLIFQNWLSHPDYDSYWQAMVPTPDEYAKISIPILTTTGYYDGSQIGAIQYFKLHHKYNRNPNHYLVIGPYDHWGAQRKPLKNLMGYEIDSIANVSMMELAYDWLDHILKNKPKPELIKDKVNYQVMGTNAWKHAPTLQNINNDTLTFYLDDTALAIQKPKKKGFKKQMVDFKDRENQNNYFTPEIVFDTLDASNGLLFKSEVFDHEFAINGSFLGQLFTTSNKKDMDVSMALYEQTHDGKYFFLTRYLGRASYAKDNTRRKLLNPNKKEDIPFDNTRFVSKKINKGSRFVILLNINKHPFEIINYGTGKSVAEESLADAGEPLHIQWHNDSYIQIPIWKN